MSTERDGGHSLDIQAIPSREEPPIQVVQGEMRSDVEKQKTQEGLLKFSRLGWKRLTILLVVEAIALGALSLPAAFAALGLVGGLVANAIIGLIAIYTGYVVGCVKIKHPELRHYADVGKLMFGKIGYEVMSFMFLLQLVFFAASHCLTGAQAFLAITNNATCSVVFSVVSAILLLALSTPPSFAEIAILGYIDFVSILLAIGITIVATGINSRGVVVDWSTWPKPGVTFTEAFVAILNILFAYSFALCQFSFMSEMHTPTDYMKSVWALGITEGIIYMITGATIFIFVGSDVKSPALLSAGHTIHRVAFGVALPVIFISGAIMVVTAGQFVHGRIYADTLTRFVNTRKGWITWIATISAIVLIGWIIAESIPFFGDLVALTSSLFNSGFTLHIPAIMWFRLLKEGKFSSKKNIGLAILNGSIIIVGLVCLVVGTYAAVQNIVSETLHFMSQLGLTTPRSTTMLRVVNRCLFNAESFRKSLA